MKLVLYPADKGDSLLITGSDGTRLLVDGGMAHSYRDFVRPALAGTKLDQVCVTHIDQDHIGGVLQLMDDVVAWRVHDFQVESGNDHHAAPSEHRPPEVSAIWHNAFHEQVSENEGTVEDLLAASAAVLFGSDDEEVRRAAGANGELATSVAEAIQLSRRIGAKQLGIPLNKEFGGKLALVRENEPATPISLGGMTVWLLAPFRSYVEDLRAEWDAWLTEHQATLANIQGEAEEDEAELPHNEGDVLQPLIAQADALGQLSKVTAPNLASIMLLVEEGEKSFLLTGDGHSDHVLDGLRHIGRIQDDGGLHVSVLKIPHHGSENNINAAFARTVTADHYVFCANGEHDNPDLRVVELVIESRISNDPAKRSANSQTPMPFTLWFNASSSLGEGDEAGMHMQEVEDLVAELTGKSDGQMRSVFRSHQTADDPGLEVLI